jgi:hypothetical protein
VQSRLVGFIVFFVIALTLVGAMHYYVWFRLVRSAAWPASWQRGAGIAIAAAAVATPIGIVLGRVLPRPTARWVADATYSWVGLLFILLTALLATELIRLFVLGAAHVAGRPFGIEQRVLLGRVLAAAVLALGVGSAVWGRIAARGPASPVELKVELSRLPATMSGFRIVQLTDLHVGDSLDGRWLARVVEQTNSLAPDLVAITGDLVDGSVAELGPEVAVLSQLRAKHGVFFVTGNHEYYSNAVEWCDELTRLGIRVLRNERVTLGTGAATFDLAGVDDYKAHEFGHGHGADLARALAGRDATRPVVLLAHQPLAVREAATHGVDLVLSGHTHGGQIWPWHHFVLLQQPVVRGLHHFGETQIYVSSGTGYWGPPVRLFAPAELTKLVLEP